jgi:hypothetical protein
MTNDRPKVSFGLTTNTERYIVVFGVDKKDCLRRFDEAYRRTPEETITNYKQLTGI